MLLSIPYNVAHELLRYDVKPRIFKILSSSSPMTVNALARKTQSSWRCVKSALQVLRDAEYVDQTGRKFVATEKVAGESFILNLRDSAADALFRWKATRALLYQLYLKPNSSLRELSYMLGLPYRTVKAVARKLKKVGLISGGTVNPQLIVRSASYATSFQHLKRTALILTRQLCSSVKPLMENERLT